MKLSAYRMTRMGRTLSVVVATIVTYFTLSNIQINKRTEAFIVITRPNQIRIDFQKKIINKSTTGVQFENKAQNENLFSISRGSTMLSSSVSAVNTSSNSKSSARTKIATSNNYGTTTLGNLIVPTVGVGTIAWSPVADGKGKEWKELETLMNTAVELGSSSETTTTTSTSNSSTGGGVFFDTAERYGSNWKTSFGLGWGETEKTLGQFIRSTSSSTTTTTTKNDNKNIIVATKFTPTPWRTTIDSVIEACEESRKRLGVEQIDLYQLHMPDIVQPLRKLGLQKDDTSKDESIYWKGLIKCYQYGLVKNVGVCNYGSTLAMKCQDVLGQANVPLASNQIAYSLLGRHNGAQRTLDTCLDRDIAVLAYYPFAMGLLTGKYNSGGGSSSSSSIPTNSVTQQQQNDAFFLKPTSSSQSLLFSASKSGSTGSKKSQLELRDLKRYVRGDGKMIPWGGITPLLNVMSIMAQNHNKTIAQIALNYIICKGAIPIPGARNEIQFLDNQGAMDFRLSLDEIQLLEYHADSLGFGFDGAGFKRTSEKFVGYGVEKWVLD